MRSVPKNSGPTRFSRAVRWPSPGCPKTSNGISEPALGGVALVAMAVIVTPVVDPMDAFRAILTTGEAVNFLALEPLHADELDIKLKQGSEVLIDQLEAAGVYELYDPDRASVAMQKPKGFSLKRLFGG